MTVQVLFALILLISSSILAIINFLAPNQALNFSSWYHVLRTKRQEYNWTRTLERTKKASSLAGILSIGGLVLSLITDLDDNIFLGLVVLIVIIFVYLSYPVKNK